MPEPTFESLGLVEPLLSALRAEGYERPTPIQVQSIPGLLAGRDLLGTAQTGTGKTAAFALPIIQRLLADRRRAAPRGARVLVVTPTRELAAQIDASFAAYGKGGGLTRACVFGGVGKTPQVQALLRGVDVLVATPGRLLDLCGEGKIRLDSVEAVVLDEADRMLDMGFIRDVRRIVALLPPRRHTLLFSATMPRDIEDLARSILRDPVRVAVAPEKPTVELIDQSVVYVEKGAKRALLSRLLLAEGAGRCLVFTRTKHGADRLVKQLAQDGVDAEAIHANKSQNNRVRTLESFRDGRVRVLVATDLAARGIDVDGITHVFNYELPNEPETYVHRIGRTARAGASGAAVAFCDDEEKPLLKAIEKLIGKRVPVDSGEAMAALVKAARKSAAERPVEAERPPREDRRFPPRVAASPHASPASRNARLERAERSTASPIHAGAAAGRRESFERRGPAQGPARAPARPAPRGGSRPGGRPAGRGGGRDER